MRSILSVEDDENISNLLRIHLHDAGFATDCVADGHEGFSALAKKDYELVILDLMLPDMDGIEFCQRIRARKNPVPILVLTAQSSADYLIQSLETGADDYMQKPFNVLELVARVKALLRRNQQHQQVMNNYSSADLQMIQDHCMSVGAIEMDYNKRKVYKDGEAIKLTAREFNLLAHLMGSPGQIFSRSQLLDSVWGTGYSGYDHTVNSHINRLRAKIEDNPNSPDYIVTVWGMGYKLNEEIAASN